MKAFWSYLKMELKRAVKRLPFLVLGTAALVLLLSCLLYTSPSPRDVEESRMPSSA